MTLAHGGGNFYDGWMKNEKSAMISCNDGFRPVSFYIEVIEYHIYHITTKEQSALQHLAPYFLLLVK